MPVDPEVVAALSLIDSPSLNLPVTKPTLVVNGGTLGLIAAGSSTATPVGGGGGTVSTDGTLTGNGAPSTPLSVVPQFGSDTTVKLPNSGSALVNAWEQVISLSTNTPGSEVSQVVLKLLSAGAQAVQVTVTPTEITLVPLLLIPSGSQASPGIGFSAEPGLGMYRVGPTELGFTAAGTPLGFWSPGALNIVQSNAQLQLSNGGAGVSVATGSLSLNANTGAFYVFVNAARFQTAQGANVASAQPLTLGNDGNYFSITGTTGIQGIVTTKWLAGSKIALQLASGITITHNSGTPGTSAAAILLRAGADLTTSGVYVLELYFNGTNWIQPS